MGLEGFLLLFRVGALVFFPFDGALEDNGDGAAVVVGHADGVIDGVSAVVGNADGAMVGARDPSRQ